MKQDKYICEPLHTLNGNKIQRDGHGAGKNIGGRLYVHRMYMKKVIPIDLLEWILKYLPYGTKYNTVMWDWNKDTIRFDEALNFDTAREPSAGKFITINTGGNVTAGHTSTIWHHKWLWVKDGYKGFDVRESHEWSKLWLSKIKEPASGSAMCWREQLKQAGL